MAGVARRAIFYYDIVCPYTYVGAHRLLGLSKAMSKANVKVEWRPVLLGALYKATEAPQGKDGSATDVMNPAKRLVTARALSVQAERVGAPLNWNPHHPVRSLEALRLILAAPEARRVEVSMRLFKAYWQDGEDVADAGVLATLASELGVDMEGMARDAAKEALRVNTEEATQRGAFGVPSFWSCSAQQLFWGEDRIHFMLQAEGVAKEDCREPRLALPNASMAPKTLTFFHDFASPWSYMASTQVERVARENNARIEYVPILLGALFKAIGTPNVPMLAVSPAKREYMSKDLQDWCAWHGVEFNFPSVFPIRTVLPLRVAIQKPEVTPLLYRAAWRKDLNIGDPEVLHRVLSDGGFDADALIEGASQQEVKDALFSGTKRAIDAGACGVPTFQVDGGEVVWGQDRLDTVVADMLCGWTPGSKPKSRM